MPRGSSLGNATRVSPCNLICVPTALWSQGTSAGCCTSQRKALAVCAVCHVVDYQEVVRVAMHDSPNAFQVASQGLRGDKEFALDAVRNNGMLLQWVYTDDEEVVGTAISTNDMAFNNASDRLPERRDLALRAVKKAPAIIQSVSDFIIAVMRDSDATLAAVSVRLRRDVDVLRLAMHRNPSNFRHALGMRQKSCLRR